MSQKKKKKLIQTLAMAVTNLHQVEKISSAVQDLGRRHVGYGVTPEDYEPVGAALLWALAQGLFTPKVRDAWTATYATIADVTKAAAAGIPPKAEKNTDLFTKAFG